MTRMARPTVLVAALVAALIGGLGAGAIALAAEGGPARAHADRAHASSGGGVSVLYAGSLVALMERGIGPAFTRSSGYSFTGFTGGSTELASQIRGGVRRGDVFVSASAKADASLQGGAGGDHVAWWSTFMASPLMLAYNPQSQVGRELARGVPWYRALTRPGIRVGRTDPVLDPKGVLTVEAVQAAARRLHDPALARALGSFAVYPEAGLVGRLQAGQLDAGFFYAVEAKTAGLRTVALAPVYKYAAYTITVLKGAPNPQGAAAFVRYMLGAGRRSALATNGLNPVYPPQFSGSRGAVPSSLRALVGAR